MKKATSVSSTLFALAFSAISTVAPARAQVPPGDTCTFFAVDNRYVKGRSTGWNYGRPVSGAEIAEINLVAHLKRTFYKARDICMPDYAEIAMKSIGGDIATLYKQLGVDVVSPRNFMIYRLCGDDLAPREIYEHVIPFKVGNISIRAQDRTYGLWQKPDVSGAGVTMNEMFISSGFDIRTRYWQPLFGTDPVCSP